MVTFKLRDDLGKGIILKLLALNGCGHGVLGSDGIGGQEMEKGNGIRMGRHRDIWKHGRAQEPLFGLGTLACLVIRQLSLLPRY